jgi:hypothetical protein
MHKHTQIFTDTHTQKYMVDKSMQESVATTRDCGQGLQESVARKRDV